MYEIHIKTHFSAAHTLAGYPGNCARLHGHNWNVELFIRCRELDNIGIGIDFKIVKEKVTRIIDKLDHRNLNDLSDFQGVNPTSEVVARYLYYALQRDLNDGRVWIAKVKVSETDDAGAFYWEE
jgi:6-pyruvoyltetrahydropterin/6-carboxytetrahydropterin synthase